VAIDWSKVKHFSSKDNWRDVSKIVPDLIYLLDSFRSFIGTPLIVTSAYREGDKAQHGLGRAVDVVAPKYEGSLFDLYLSAERYAFTGIGLYRDWKHDNKKIGGLHLDVRILSENEKAARWTCVKNSSGTQVYLPMNLETLKKEGFV